MFSIPKAPDGLRGVPARAPAAKAKARAETLSRASVLRTAARAGLACAGTAARWTNLLDLPTLPGRLFSRSRRGLRLPDAQRLRLRSERLRLPALYRELHEPGAPRADRSCDSVQFRLQRCRASLPAQSATLPGAWQADRAHAAARAGALSRAGAFAAVRPGRVFRPLHRVLRGLRAGCYSGSAGRAAKRADHPDRAQPTSTAAAAGLSRIRLARRPDRRTLSELRADRIGHDLGGDNAA